MKKTIFDNYENTYSFEEAKQYCIDRHLEDEPSDTDWTPSDEEVYEEIESCNQICWEDASYYLKKFFDNGDTFILKGYAGLWNGPQEGGKVIHNFKDLSLAWAEVDYVQIYDEGGTFGINGYHHDGTNHWEVKKLTKKGTEYLSRHEYDDPRTLHNKLWSSGYSKNLHFYKKSFES